MVRQPNEHLSLQDLIDPMKDEFEKIFLTNQKLKPEATLLIQILKKVNIEFFLTHIGNEQIAKKLIHDYELKAAQRFSIDLILTLLALFFNLPSSNPIFGKFTKDRLIKLLIINLIDFGGRSNLYLNVENFFTINLSIQESFNKKVRSQRPEVGEVRTGTHERAVGASKVDVKSRFSSPKIFKHLNVSIQEFIDFLDAYKGEKEQMEDAIKRFFRNFYWPLAFKYHPDKNTPGDKVSEAKFKEVGAAYGILSDQEKRNKYLRGFADFNFKDPLMKKAFLKLLKLN